ncbi:MAG: trypsin-like serine protease [Pseudomonadota bacterium]
MRYFIYSSVLLLTVFASPKFSTVRSLNDTPVVLDNSFPYTKSVVAIGYYFKSPNHGKGLSGKFFPFCTGSVLERRTLITAAHCLENVDLLDIYEQDGISFARPFENREVEIRVAFVNNFAQYMAGPNNTINMDQIPFSLTVDRWKALEARNDSTDVALLHVTENIPDDYPSLPLIARGTFVESDFIGLIGFNFSGTQGVLRMSNSATIDGDVMQILFDIKDVSQVPKGNSLLLIEQKEEGVIPFFIVRGHGPDGGSSGGPILALFDGQWKLVSVIDALKNILGSTVKYLQKLIKLFTKRTKDRDTV